MRNRLLTPRAFRDAAQHDCHAAKALRVGLSLPAEIRAADAAESRELQFTISTAGVDRMRDTIQAAGWKLDAYRKNPVVLWAHDNSLLPVAKATRVWIEGDALKATAEFTPPELARFNDTVFALLRQGFLSAVSVGFQPLKWAWVDTDDRPYGIDFLEQELLEFSIVTVPANAEALIEAPGKALADPAAAAAAAMKRLRQRRELDLLAPSPR